MKNGNAKKVIPRNKYMNMIRKKREKDLQGINLASGLAMRRPFISNPSRSVAKTDFNVRAIV